MVFRNDKCELIEETLELTCYDGLNHFDLIIQY